MDAQKLFDRDSIRSRQPFSLQDTFETVDSYNETITVFNMTTTISPNTESPTKVSIETFDTILEALDSAAGAIDGTHFSTGILGDFTTHHKLYYPISAKTHNQVYNLDKIYCKSKLEENYFNAFSKNN